MRYELTEYEWAAIRPMLPNKPRGVPACTIDVSSTASFGCWDLARHGVICRNVMTSCYNRFVRWRRASVWRRLMDALAAAHDAAIQDNRHQYRAGTSARRVRMRRCEARTRDETDEQRDGEKSFKYDH